MVVVRASVIVHPRKREERFVVTSILFTFFSLLMFASGIVAGFLGISPE
jgi:hypothetical protein